MSDDSPTPYQEAAERARAYLAESAHVDPNEKTTALTIGELRTILDALSSLEAENRALKLWQESHEHALSRHETVVAQREALEAESRVLQGRIDAALARHRPTDVWPFDRTDQSRKCVRCDSAGWPCPTVHALTGGDVPRRGPMSDAAAERLREEADEIAKSHDRWGAGAFWTDVHDDIIALLSEREADKRRIAELGAVVEACADAGYAGCRCGEPERGLECGCHPITRALAALVEEETTDG